MVRKVLISGPVSRSEGCCLTGIYNIFKLNIWTVLILSVKKLPINKPQLIKTSLEDKNVIKLCTVINEDKTLLLYKRSIKNKTVE